MSEGKWQPITAHSGTGKRYAADVKVYNNQEIRVKLDEIFGGKSNEEMGLYNEKAKVLQKAVRSYLFRKKMRTLITQYRDSDDAKPQRQRIRIIREIVSSEEVYVSSLSLLMSEFYLPLIELEKQRHLFSSKTITMEDIQKIFANVQVIHDFHFNTFLPSLQKELLNFPNPVCLGKIILTFAPYLKLYTVYSNNFDTSLATLEECKKKSSFMKWLTATETKTKVTIASLLINPIQRIPRYKLLINELLKYTSPEHVDYTSITTALDQIDKVAKYINTSKGAAENVSSVENKQKNIVGLPLNFAHPKRKFLFEGTLSRKFHSSKHNHESRLFYLFSDLLLSVKPQENEMEKYIYDGYILLRGATFNFDVSSKAFEILFSNGKKVEYTCKSSSEKEDWVKYLNESLQLIAAQPKEQAADYLMEVEHFGTGATKIEGTLELSKKGLIFKGFISLRVKLESNVLFMYKKDKLSDIIQLENYSLTHLRHLTKPAFQLSNKECFYVFVGQSKDEITQWVKAIEDAKKDEQTPITDITLIHMDKGELCPIGFTPILRSYFNHPGNLNEYSKGREIILCYSRNKDKSPITSIGIGMLDNDNILRRRWNAEEIDPKTWTKLEKTFYGASGNLNEGGSGRDIFIYYMRGDESSTSKITRISTFMEGMKLPNNDIEKCPDQFIPIRNTITGKYFADINAGNGNQPTYICYQTDNETDYYLYKLLGWDNFLGFKRSNLANDWNDFLTAIGIASNNDRLSKEYLLFLLNQFDRSLSQMSAGAPPPSQPSQPPPSQSLSSSQNPIMMNTSYPQSAPSMQNSTGMMPPINSSVIKNSTGNNNSQSAYPAPSYPQQQQQQSYSAYPSPYPSTVPNYPAGNMYYQPQPQQPYYQQPYYGAAYPSTTVPYGGNNNQAVPYPSSQNYYPLTGGVLDPSAYVGYAYNNNNSTSLYPPPSYPIPQNQIQPIMNPQTVLSNTAIINSYLPPSPQTTSSNNINNLPTDQTQFNEIVDDLSYSSGLKEKKEMKNFEFSDLTHDEYKLLVSIMKERITRKK